MAGIRIVVIDDEVTGAGMLDVPFNGCVKSRMDITSQCQRRQKEGGVRFAGRRVIELHACFIHHRCMNAFYAPLIMAFYTTLLLSIYVFWHISISRGGVDLRRTLIFRRTINNLIFRRTCHESINYENFR